MQNELENIGHRDDQMQDTAQTDAERALGAGSFRCRPLWRFERPDQDYGPRLTLAARQLLAEESHYAANHHD